MGWIRHHGIVVTGSSFSESNFDNESKYAAVRARAKALELGLLASNVVDAPINGYASFLIAPDGSKEGWETSEDFNARRESFINWLKEQACYDWFEYAQDVDNDQLTITASSIIEETEL